MSELNSALAGSAAAAIATSLVYPVDTVKTRLSIGFDSKGQPYHSLIDVLSRSTKERGIISLYQGLHAKLGMTVLQRFVYYYALAYLQKRYSARYGKLTFSMSLLLGYLAGVISSAVTTPAEVIQTKLQVSDSVTTEKSHQET